jgi:isochorismate hydrolase
MNQVKMQEYTLNAQYTIHVNRPKKTLKGILQQAKGNCLDRGPSDQMVLRAVRRAAGPHERQPKHSRLS